MELKVIASTKLNNLISKEEADTLGGYAAGVCYLKDNMDKLLSEPAENTQRRIARTKKSGHTSPYEHANITLQIVGVPKIIAMMLNNEKVYVTSEKSARYRVMEVSEEEKKYFDKWHSIFSDRIRQEYQEKCPSFFTDETIGKLAQENARYLTSVFTPTTMLHTISYRQFNILYSLFVKESEILKTQTDEFSKRLKIEVDKFIAELEKLPYIDEKLFDNKNRQLSLIDRRTDRAIIKQYGDAYLVSYKGSFAQLAQAQRHRTIDYSLKMPETCTFFVPPIIKKDEVLSKAWLDDCNALSGLFPQGLMVDIIENGTIKNLIMKAKERKCTRAQLEVDNQTTATIKDVYENLKQQNHPAKDDLEPYVMKESRCHFPDFKCVEPCGFKDGIMGERLI